MKKLLALVIAGVLIVMPTSAAFAESVTDITWGDDTNASAPTTGATDSPASDSNTNSKSKPYLALGSDLSASQQATVMSLMGLNGTDLSNYNVVYVTNAEERQYLGSYISSSAIGTKSLSSVLVRPAESGHGINVTTHNINYCTEGMYKNALLTAGIEDADIIVAAPTSISGTAALIGALKAYAEMTDTTLNTQALDTSLDELVTTGQLEEAAQAIDGVSSEDVEALIAFIKAEIAKRDLSDRAGIEEAVRGAITDYNAQYGKNVTLSEEHIAQIVDLMEKINKLGLDYGSLLDQATELYNKYGSNLTGDNIADVLEKNKKEIVGSVAKSAVKSVFKSIGNKLASFFKGLFG